MRYRTRYIYVVDRNRYIGDRKRHMVYKGEIKEVEIEMKKIKENRQVGEIEM